MSYSHRSGDRRGGGSSKGGGTTSNIYNAFRANDFSPGSIHDQVSQLSSTLPATSPSRIEDTIKWHLSEIAQNRFGDNDLRLAVYASVLDQRQQGGRWLARIIGLVFEEVRGVPDARLLFDFARLSKSLMDKVLPTAHDQHMARHVTGQPVLGSDLVRHHLDVQCHHERDRLWDVRRRDSSDRACLGWLAFAQFTHALYLQSTLNEDHVHICIEKLFSLSKHAIIEASVLGTMLLETSSKRYQDRNRMNRHYVQTSELASTSRSQEVRAVFRESVQKWCRPPANAEQTYQVCLQMQQLGMFRHIPDTGGGQIRPRIPPNMPLDTVMRSFREYAGLKDYTAELNRIPRPREPHNGGGNSDVYQVRLNSGQIAAIKAIHSRGTGEANATKLAARELDVWFRLRHQNILNVLGMANFYGEFAIVLPWMAGNVIEMVERNPGVNRFDIGRQIASAVAYIHSNKVIHGDLKGANVLVGEDGVIRVTDFGTTKLREGVFEYSLTNRPDGTTRWMAPELFLPNHTRTYATDMYALAMVS
ncbi:hypothetical protein FRC09_009377 [Ceratobasidium sp. 395]|nr:hypothetical protein FRC09_009377 [Ceratobasidium sp. 395]